MRRELTFHGNKETTLNKEIALYLTNWEEGDDPSCIPDYEIGMYMGKTVFKIEGILYQLTKNSWVCNSEYNWHLKEVSENCYNKFK